LVARLLLYGFNGYRFSASEDEQVQADAAPPGCDAAARTDCALCDTVLVLNTTLRRADQ